MRLFLQRNQKAVDEVKFNGITKLPYFKIKIIPEEKGGEWIEVASLWKSQNGVGYSGKLADGVTLTFTKPPQKQSEMVNSDGTKIPFPQD